MGRKTHYEKGAYRRPSGRRVRNLGTIKLRNALRRNSDVRKLRAMEKKMKAEESLSLEDLNKILWPSGKRMPGALK